MSQQHASAANNRAAIQSPSPSSDLRERVGITIAATDDATALLAYIAEAEAQGVRQLWMTQSPTSFDALSIYAAAFARTQHIRLGTSIVPTYPRHPLALAQQTATVAAVGPGRLRLGVGTSHRRAIEDVYGLPMGAPLAHSREYIEVLRAALWDGTVDHRGRFFTANVRLPNPPRVPLLMAALGADAFQLAGAIADGAISWNCPVSYLHDVALPALYAGAESADRPIPSMVAHMWVALGVDASAVRAVMKKELLGFARVPYFAAMFAAAGYRVQDNGTVSDQLIDTLVVMGDASAVASRLAELLASGLDELLLTQVPLGDAAVERTRLMQLVGRL
jgi:F420-dependent oxidoreductase-like protein